MQGENDGGVEERGKRRGERQGQHEQEGRRDGARRRDAGREEPKDEWREKAGECSMSGEGWRPPLPERGAALVAAGVLRPGRVQAALGISNGCCPRPLARRRVPRKRRLRRQYPRQLLYRRNQWPQTPTLLLPYPSEDPAAGSPPRPAPPPSQRMWPTCRNRTATTSRCTRTSGCPIARRSSRGRSTGSERSRRNGTGPSRTNPASASTRREGWPGEKYRRVPNRRPRPRLPLVAQASLPLLLEQEEIGTAAATTGYGNPLCQSQGIDGDVSRLFERILCLQENVDLHVAR